MRLTTALTALFIFFWPAKGWALAEDFVKTLCMPEKTFSLFMADRHHFIEQDGMGGDPERRAVLLKYGLLAERHFNYTCSLGHEYKINGHYQQRKSQGQCGGDPRTIISLTQDGQLIFKDVFFSDSCFQNRKGYEEETFIPYLKSFLIDDKDKKIYATIVDFSGEERSLTLKSGFIYTQDAIACVANKRLEKECLGK